MKKNQFDHADFILPIFRIFENNLEKIVRKFENKFHWIRKKMMHKSITKTDSNSANLLSKINFSIALLICFLFPLLQKNIPLLLAVWVLTFILSGKKTNFFSKIYESKATFILILFFILHVICLLYTENISSGIFDIESKLSLLVFPIVFPHLSNLYHRKFKWILYSFIAGCTIASFICLSHSFYLYYQFKVPFQYFTYTDLSIFMHPTYFAMYLCFSVMCIIYLLWNSKLHKLSKIGLSSLFLLHGTMVFLLSSKAGIIALFLLLIILFIFQFRKRKLMLFAGIALAFGLLLLAFQNDRFESIKHMIAVGIGAEKADNNERESSNERVIIWKSSLELLRENWMLGVGSGDVKYDLMKKYSKKNFEVGQENKLNAHNQYLETFLSVGILGIALLLIVLINQLIKAIRSKNLLLFSFIFLFLINFSFESILNNQAGIVFFAFFYCLLIYNSRQVSTSESYQASISHS